MSKKTITAALVIFILVILAGFIIASINNESSDQSTNTPTLTTLRATSSEGSVHQAINQYQNSRFGFSFGYPASFTRAESPQNNDGIVLTSTDGSASIRAFAANNVGNESFDELETTARENNFASVTDVQTAGDARVLYGATAAGQDRIQRIEIQNNNVFTLQITHDGPLSAQTIELILNSFSIDEAEVFETTTIQLAMLDYQDRGQESAGPERGCDRVIYIERSVPQTSASLTVALRKLFSLESEVVSGWNNFIAKTNDTLSFQRATIEDGRANIYLEGELSGLAGVCDNPRASIQIGETALQFETVNSVQIYVNGEPTSLMPDERGE